MCGIVGYIGPNNATEIILDGLSKLEYRGYDSAGLSIYNDGQLVLEKYKGRLRELEKKISDKELNGNLGIGHTRWATHGKPDDENSHPHMSDQGKYVIVHNGIIENFTELKEKLKKEKITFKSETDSEVVAHLLEYVDEADFLTAVYKVLDLIEGSYALGIVSKEDPDKLIAVRKGSPLIVGTSNTGNYIASDVPALLKYTNEVIYINDNEVVLLENDRVTVYDSKKNKLEKDITTIEWDLESATKGGYAHFMLKEIHEQPEAAKLTLKRRLKKGIIDFSDIDNNLEFIKDIDKIQIIAAGTASYAGLIGKTAIEHFVKKPVSVEISSEYRYKEMFTDKKTLAIIVSQSGETIDTLYALREAKSKGAKVLAITNVVGSTIAREADYVIYTWAGPEIAVASTKAYTMQVLTLFMMSLNISLKLGFINEKDYKKEINKLKLIPKKLSEVLELETQIKKVANTVATSEDAYYIGRGVDYYTAQEGSLKLKEVSYIHSEALPSGELKHGTIALIEDKTLVVLVSTSHLFNEKNLSNIKEVKARGAFCISITNEDFILNESDLGLKIPEFDDIYMPIISVIPVQLLAYYTSIKKGIDVDKPRNLAKSVTVE